MPLLDLVIAYRLLTTPSSPSSPSSPTTRSRSATTDSQFPTSNFSQHSPSHLSPKPTHGHRRTKSHSQIPQIFVQPPQVEIQIQSPPTKTTSKHMRRRSGSNIPQSGSYTPPFRHSVDFCRSSSEKEWDSSGSSGGESEGEIEKDR